MTCVFEEAVGRLPSPSRLGRREVGKSLHYGRCEWVFRVWEPRFACEGKGRS